MIVITGGGTGIGRALAIELAAKHKSVLIIGRSIEPLLETAAKSNFIQYCQADVSTPEGRAIIQHAISNTQIEALVHNAGLIAPIEKIATVSPLAWENIFHTNLFAPFQLTQQLLKQLIGGRVLHIGSGAAHFPVVGWSGYCVSKAALSMLTRCYQLEIHDPVFSSVMPGIVATTMTAIIRQSAESMSAEQQAFHQKIYQQGLLIQPETVGLFLAWLLFEVDRASYCAKEWDIYDTTHHASWLKEGHHVPLLNL